MIQVVTIVLVILGLLIFNNYRKKTSLTDALSNDTSESYKEQLVETDDYKAPPGYILDAVEVIPELELRTATWLVDNPKGTILLFSGFTEFIEKYYETISDLKKRNWNIVAFDWRGQGLSSKLLLDSNKGYIENFEHFLEDAEVIYQKKISHLPRPHNLLAHSMGGHLAFRELQEHPERFDRAVLCAPMQAIKGMNTRLLDVTSSFFEALGFGQSYVFGGSEGDINKTHERLTKDEMRFKKWSSIFKKEPRLLMGSATWSWSNAAAESMAHSMQVEQIKKIKTPVYLASAKSEVVVNEHIHEGLDDINPIIRVVPYEHARHEIMTEIDEHRTRFINEIDAFLSS